MARRGWSLAAAVALLVTLAAGPAPAWAQVEVRMWTLLSGGDGARMRALVDDFNASQRDVRVVSTTLKWGEPFYTKLITSSVVGAGPDGPPAGPPAGQPGGPGGFERRSRGGAGARARRKAA